MPQSFNSLLTDIRRCRICVDAPRGAPLPHTPRPVLQVSTRARLAIFGQAPGKRVHESGQPFTDPSGDRLRDWLGVSEAEFYDPEIFAIIPMGFCFPGYNEKGADLPPRKECAPAWRASVTGHLADLRSTILVGGYAQSWHLGKDAGKTLSQTVSKWRNFAPKFFTMPHPSWRNNAWLKKNPWFETDLLPVLRAQVRRVIECG